MLLPGVEIEITPTDYSGMRQLQLMKLDSDRWKIFGGMINVGTN